MDYKERIRILTDENPFISKTDIVYKLLLEDILDQTMPGGFRLNQRDLSAQMGLSRSPVREALMRLSEDGYLVAEDGGSYHVYELRLEDYISINDFRTVLEVGSIGQTIKSITVDEISDLRDCLKSADAALARDDIGTFLDLDGVFHMSLIRATRNPYLIRTYEDCTQEFQLFAMLTFPRAMMPGDLKWHEKIYRDIVDNDIPSAEADMKMHRESTMSGAMAMIRGRR